MKVIAFLTKNRYEAGSIHIQNGAGDILGPWRARGEADNTAAKKAGNEREDPTSPYGDHPSGLSRVEQIIETSEAEFDKYGKYFIKLEPLNGEAKEAKDKGRTGIGIHSGKLHTDGRLRETYGCLRVDPETLQFLVDRIQEQFLASRVVLYECRIIDE